MRLVLSVFILTASLYAQNLRTKINEGNQHYSEESYEEALAAYRDALLDDPLNEVASFNQGDALYKLKKYEQAVEVFQKLIGSEDISLASQAYFNTGNSYFQLEKYKEAIDAYQKALEFIPDDYDAKYNLELTRAKIKEMSDKQQQNQQQDQEQEKMEPSEFAKKLKEHAEKMVLERKYKEALQLLQDGMKKDPTVAAFQDFMQRTTDIITILEGV